jgi:hypothetical protein
MDLALVWFVGVISWWYPFDSLSLWERVGVRA